MRVFARISAGLWSGPIALGIVPDTAQIQDSASGLPKEEPANSPARHMVTARFVLRQEPEMTGIEILAYLVLATLLFALGGALRRFE